ncbi:MAG TPA: pyridoxamine 5'-phosphate oxidase [Bacteroidia bacterium]|nr:pyridoxamine 5'-phosphate oxidase [Bacteroidia bacterium]
MKKIEKKIFSDRKNYTKDQLDEKLIEKNPIVQFEKWLELAIKADVEEPHVTVLSTATKTGKPSARIVLLRKFSENGFSFYTNYTSRKGKELAQNPYATLTFFWQSLEKQIRIEGIIEKQTKAESDEYFASRPHESKIGAWASPQSKTIKNRSEIDTAFAAYEKKFSRTEIPRPSHWGGYVLKPTIIEFWQGRKGRLHDRVLYTLKKNVWTISRLAP